MRTKIEYGQLHLDMDKNQWCFSTLSGGTIGFVRSAHLLQVCNELGELGWKIGISGWYDYARGGENPDIIFMREAE